jgi:hypothetical protein
VAVQLHDLTGAVLDAQAAGVAQRRDLLADGQRGGMAQRHRPCLQAGHLQETQVAGQVARLPLHGPAQAGAQHVDLLCLARDMAVGHHLVGRHRHRRAEGITSARPRRFHAQHAGGQAHVGGLVKRGERRLQRHGERRQQGQGQQALHGGSLPRPQGFCAA